MGGSLTAEDTPGGGLTMVFTLRTDPSDRITQQHVTQQHVTQQGKGSPE
jgi:two-component system sensor histidine kinase KdpD